MHPQCSMGAAQAFLDARGRRPSCPDCTTPRSRTDTHHRHAFALDDESTMRFDQLKWVGDFSRLESST
jgi:hypothetical protein